LRLAKQLVAPACPSVSVQVLVRVLLLWCLGVVACCDLRGCCWKGQGANSLLVLCTAFLDLSTVTVFGEALTSYKPGQGEELGKFLEKKDK